jgi:hypothetical protein
VILDHGRQALDKYIKSISTKYDKRGALFIRTITKHGDIDYFTTLSQYLDEKRNSINQMLQINLSISQTPSDTHVWNVFPHVEPLFYKQIHAKDSKMSRLLLDKTRLEEEYKNMFNNK